MLAFMAINGPDAPMGDTPMFEVVDLTYNYSQGGFDTLDEARGAVAFDKLTTWAIYNRFGDVVESSE